MRTFKTILYWILSFIWGTIMTLIGCVCALALLITGHKPKKFYHSIYFEVGKNWGGFEAGCFFFCNEYSSLHTKQHEHGHGLQNIILGPFMPFVVSIPSCLRYWFREMKDRKARIIYIILTTLIPVVLGGTAIACGFIFNLIWLWILGIIWCLYFIGVCGIWQTLELPKYDNYPWPAYDDFYVEGWATKWGEKYFK